MKIDTIIVHHTGGRGNDHYASTQKLTVRHIDNAHKARWSDFRSDMGYWVGYNFLIFPDGKVIQTRLIGEETAHTVGMNTRAIGICFVGNNNKWNGLPVDKRTPQAISAYRSLVKNIRHKVGVKIKQGTVVSIPEYRNYPHRAFSMTQCYGDFYSNSWCRDILREKPRLSINVIIKLFLFLKAIYGERKAKRELIKIISAIGSAQVGRECSGNL